MRDYFAVLGFAASFSLDDAALHAAYLAAQRQFHPDRQASPTARMSAIQASADCNAAYRILKDPLLRAEHLLALQGVMVGGEKDTVKPSQPLLIESMEMREALMECESAAAVEQLHHTAQQAIHECGQRFAASFASARYSEAAQAVLRWRFLIKFCEEIRAQKKLAAIK
ncbi:MAG: Fe-S protein assembly co-chaperone HscB [Rickettsiales bacterium]|nr:Fe-S protein assembly co-chaperone HscB [Rickettsiales bacterium]